MPRCGVPAVKPPEQSGASLLGRPLYRRAQRSAPSLPHFCHEHDWLHLDVADGWICVKKLKSALSRLKSALSRLRSDDAELRSQTSGLNPESSDLKSRSADLNPQTAGLRSPMAGRKSAFAKFNPESAEHHSAMRDLNSLSSIIQ